MNMCVHPVFIKSCFIILQGSSILVSVYSQMSFSAFSHFTLGFCATGIDSEETRLSRHLRLFYTILKAFQRKTLAFLPGHYPNIEGDILEKGKSRERIQREEAKQEKKSKIYVHA
jgi:hypothetical protein